MFSKKKITTGQIPKFVGVQVTPANFTYLTLYTLAHNTGKSPFINELLKKWQVDEEKELSQDMLIEKIVVDAIDYAKAEVISIARVAVMARVTLNKAKLPFDIVDAIVKGINNAEEK